MKRSLLGAAAIATLATVYAAGADAKTLVYCSEGSPEGFAPYAIHGRHDLRRIVAADLQSTRRVQGRNHRDPAWPRREMGSFGRRADLHLPPAQGRQVPFDQGLQADARHERGRRRSSRSSGSGRIQPVLQALGRELRILPGHGHGRPAEVDRQGRRPHGQFVLNKPEAPFIANLGMDFASIASKEHAEAMQKAGTPEQVDLASGRDRARSCWSTIRKTPSSATRPIPTIGAARRRSTT